MFEREFNAKRFINACLAKDLSGSQVYTIGIIRNGAKYQPDWLEWLTDFAPEARVKVALPDGSNRKVVTALADYRVHVTFYTFFLSNNLEYK